MAPGYKERLYAPNSDDEDDSLSQKALQNKIAAIEADETGGKGVNFVEYNVVLDACASAGDLAVFRCVLEVRLASIMYLTLCLSL